MHKYSINAQSAHPCKNTITFNATRNLLRPPNYALIRICVFVCTAPWTRYRQTSYTSSFVVPLASVYKLYIHNIVILTALLILMESSHSVAPTHFNTTRDHHIIDHVESHSPYEELNTHTFYVD